MNLLNDNIERKQFVIKYLKSLLIKIEQNDLNVNTMQINHEVPRSDGESFNIEIKMNVIGFAPQLYNLSE